jgi:divalent metal cation (Fe/Co/Zn/Cd) transporter
MGISLFVGRSSTQLADFIRRTAELLAIIVSLLVYKAVQEDTVVDKGRRMRLESLANQCVGSAMCLSGVTMVIVTLLSKTTEKGNVIPGLVIAALGVMTNGWFWLRYRRLNSEGPDAILMAQSKLYRAKTLVDTCVLLSLAFVAAAPTASMTLYVDMAGSTAVAAYLVFSGLSILRGKA